MFPDFVNWLGAEKTLADDPWWYFDTPQEDRYILSVPLQINHVVEAGLFLDGNCVRNAPEEQVTFLLTYKPTAGASGPLARIDWKPLGEHRNRGLVKGEFRFKPIVGTHIHPFGENFLLGPARMWRENLPKAYPIAGPIPRFRELLDYMGAVWNVAEVQRIPVPEWAPRLI